MTAPTSATPTSRRPSWPRALAWAATGVAGAVGVLGILTIGMFILPVVYVAVGSLLLGTRPLRFVSAALVAESLPMFIAARFLWGGPVHECHDLAGGGISCTDIPSPYPWLALGIVLLVGGGTWWLALGRRPRT